MQNDDDELDLKHLDDPDAPKSETSASEPTEPAQPETAPGKPVVGKSAHPYRKWVVLGLVLIVAVIVWAYWLGTNKASAPSVNSATNNDQTTSQQSDAQLKLDTSKDYGNKYMGGILPVGDGKYDSTVAKKGYVYTCSGYANNLQNQQGGAGSRGPWFTNNNTEYDVNKKAHVRGSITWSAEFSNAVNGSTRTITTNGLPSHPTGVFPIAMSDPAYAYDRNPNSIKTQDLTYALPSSPTYSATPNCMGGEAGVMLTGIALFNGFDAGGRDAGAWEVQDSCAGHPQKEGEYHYHTLSSCIKDVNVRTVIGYALDGFPITGPQLSANNILTTADLDACHGITSEVVLDGKPVTTYHYVMTQDFPYSISCFRGTPTNPPNQPGAKQ